MLINTTIRITAVVVLTWYASPDYSNIEEILAKVSSERRASPRGVVGSE
jgi:hypothetical protein